MIKTFLTILTVFLVLYLLIGVCLYFFQENLIFFPQKLDRDYQFRFEPRFEEKYIVVEGGDRLHGLWFKAEAPKGLIFYLHGNAGSLSSWGEVGKSFTDLNYDVFVLDYRGYGKSSGFIRSQQQLFQDVQTVYEELMEHYSEEKTIVLGYSVGTGPASYLAANNRPKLLILLAPFYSLTDIVKRRFPIIPSFLLKYKFETYKYVSECTMPVVVFHGDLDEVIDSGSSIKLKAHFKSQDTLIILNRQGHIGIADHKDYKREIKKILDQL